MQSPMRKNSQLPPISPNLGMNTTQSNYSGRDLSKPKTYQMMQGNNMNGSFNNSLGMAQRNIPRGNTPQRRNIQKLIGQNADDQISEIDMNSDARSMHSAQLGRLPMKKNNLMGTGNNFESIGNRSNYDKGWGNSQLSDSRGLLDAQSNFGDSASGSNMFHPRAAGQKSQMDA